MTMTDEQRNERAPDLAEGIPGLVRVAATSSWRTLKWAVGSTVRINTEIVERTLQGEPVQVVLQDTANEIRHFAWQALGLEDQQKQLEGSPGDDGQSGGIPGLGNFPGSGTITGAASSVLNAFSPSGPPGDWRTRLAEDTSPEQLRARGQRLLQDSADVDVVEEGHPAYARILTELTPDEARILRFLYREGPQPSIDIRTNRPFGIGSELIAGRLSMIGEYAGLRHLDRIDPYLINLVRVGLIDFSKEPVSNPNRYQVIEAQPRMTEAMKQAGRAPRIVRKSIQLNAFGEDFCTTCLFGDDPPHPQEHE